MQIFIPFKEPLMVAKCLDKLRLNKQIVECRQIIDAIEGRKKGWINHPVVKMYRPYKDWLLNYSLCLAEYVKSEKYRETDYTSFFHSYRKAVHYSMEADKIRPPFIIDELCTQHKKRLYTKNPIHYKEFSHFGESEENWYVVDGKVLKYSKGKLISD